MLASDEAAYMTGAELTIDGGILAGSAAPPGGDGAEAGGPEGDVGAGGTAG
jgi:hypothetical protein